MNRARADDVLAIMVKAAGGSPAIQDSDVAREMQSRLSYFKQVAPIKVEDSSDQYFFDIELYALYQLVAQRLPTSEQRVAFRERVGDGILASILTRRPLPLGAGGGKMRQADIARGIEEILLDFETSGLIKAFVFDAEDFGDERFAQESFEQDQPVSTQIQLIEPCSVLSFIEGVKQNTFFHPEFVGCTLAQYVKRCAGGGTYAARFEDYLLDEFYRESNFDVQAQDVMLELRMGTRATFPP